MYSSDTALLSQEPDRVQERTPGSHGRALGFCVVALLGLFCVGYDQALVSRIVGFDSFESKFCAECSPTSTPEDWIQFRSWYSDISTIGYILGAFVAGYLADAAGRKWTIMVGMLVFSLGTIWVMLSSAREGMLSGRVFQGIGGGMYTLTLPIYCVEVATKELRGSLAGFAQLVLGLGFVAGAYATSEFVDTNWVLLYYVPLVPAMLLTIVSVFLPESPRWVNLHKGMELAEISLKHVRATRIVQHELDAFVTQASSIADITGWRTLAHRSILKRLVVITALLIFQLIFALLNSISFESLVKMHKPSDFIPDLFDDFQLVYFVIYAICALPALFIVDIVGRYRLLVVGGMGMKLGHVLIGVAIKAGCDAEIFGRTCRQGSADFVLIGTAIVVFSDMVCWVPVLWLYPAELFPTNVRAKATSIAAVISGASLFWVRQLFPHLVEMSIITAVLVILALVIVHKACHETKGVLLEDTEELFADGFHSKLHRSSVSVELPIVGDPLRTA